MFMANVPWTGKESVNNLIKQLTFMYVAGASPGKRSDTFLCALLWPLEAQEDVWEGSKLEPDRVTWGF